MIRWRGEEKLTERMIQFEGTLRHLQFQKQNNIIAKPNQWQERIQEPVIINRDQNKTDYSRYYEENLDRSTDLGFGESSRGG